MHKWNKAILLAMVTGLLFGAAAPAHAQQIPFNVNVPVPGGVTVGISPVDQGTGFVGACDVRLQCTGASVRVAHTDGEVVVGGAAVHLAGTICVSDQASPCGAAGDPGTGVVFTRRDVTLGRTGAEVPEFTLEYCVWERDPRFSPSSCSTTVIDPTVVAGVPISTETTISLGQFIPERIVVSTGKAT
jgi:hypothetical protein